MTKRALLILIGGRQVPNVLVAQALRPDIILPIASHEAMRKGREWEKVMPILRRLCPQGLRPPVVVDAFDPRETYVAALRSLLEEGAGEWVFNVTCGSKVMGFGAYDAALPEYLPAQVSIWYLDSATRRVVVLKGRAPESDLFRLTVADYFAAYGRQAVGSNPSAEDVAFARLIARDGRAATLARGVRSAKRKGATLEFLAPAKNLAALMKAARAAGYVRQFKLGAAANRPGYGRVRDCEVEEEPGKSLLKFVTGDWLETYAWWAAGEAGCFDDARCGLEIPDGAASNELDLAATRAATLLVAECKTDDGDFKKIKEKGYVEKLHSIAGLVGGNFVGRLFITSQCPPTDAAGLRSYNAFCEQARARQVVVVTGDQLKDLPAILRRESGDQPTFSHI
jgi:hypothetical protein